MSSETPPSPKDSLEPVEPIEIDVYVRFENGDPTKPRVTMLSYFNEESRYVAGLELRLDRGVEYLLRFAIVGRTPIVFEPGSIVWADIQDPWYQSCPPPPAVQGTAVSSDGRVLEMTWLGDKATPAVNIFTVAVAGGAGQVAGVLDPTIINKPPEFKFVRPSRSS